MNYGDELACGIDIGSDSVRAVLARIPDQAPGEDGSEPIEILGAGQALAGDAVQYGDIVRISEAADAIRAAVEELEQAAGVDVRRAYVAMGSRRRRAINCSGQIAVADAGSITVKDVERAIRAAVPQGGGAWLQDPYKLLHALPQEFWVDDLDATDDPTGWTGRTIQSFVHLVACPGPTLERMEQAVNATGVKVEKFVISALASGMAVLEPEERKGNVLLLDCGAMTTDIALFRRGALWHSDVMPAGGRHYTSDVAGGLQLGYGEAERVKRQYGSALKTKVPAGANFRVESVGRVFPRRVLADILQRRAEFLFTRIRDELRRLRLDKPGRVVLTGGGAQLEGIQEVSRLVFGAEAESRGGVGVGGPLQDPASQPRFAAAVGLVRFGLKEARAAARRARTRGLRGWLLRRKKAG